MSHLFEFRFAFVFPFIGFHSASWTFLCTHVCISFFKFASVSVFHRFLRFLSFSFISIFCILSRNHVHEFDMQHLHVAHWIKVIMVLVMATVTKPQWEHWTATFHISCFYPPIPPPPPSSFRWTYIPTLWYNVVQEVIPTDCYFLFVTVTVLERF